jgi:hypothetical protein
MYYSFLFYLLLDFIYFSPSPSFFPHVVYPSCNKLYTYHTLLLDFTFHSTIKKKRKHILK